MTIESIRKRDFTREDYTPEEIEAMKHDASSSATLNKVRRDAGIGGRDVVVRGDDKSNDELKKSWDDHDFGDSGIGAVRDMLIEGTEGTILHLVGPAMFIKEGLGALATAEKRGEELATNNERAAMHVGMLVSLDLPAGYKNVEVDRWKAASSSYSSGAMKIGTALETVDKKEAARLQLHADRGMYAARERILAGRITRGGDDAETRRVIDADPELKAKYDSDPAYRAGFDALVWAHRHDTAQHDEALRHLEARDARYAQHSISFRG